MKLFILSGSVFKQNRKTRTLTFKGLLGEGFKIAYDEDNDVRYIEIIPTEGKLITPRVSTLIGITPDIFNDIINYIYLNTEYVFSDIKSMFVESEVDKKYLENVINGIYIIK